MEVTVKDEKDRKSFVSQTYFKLIYYSELYSSNYEDRIEIYNKRYLKIRILPQNKRNLVKTELQETLKERKNYTKEASQWNAIFKSFFGTWTSGCDIIDRIICECQSSSGLPLHIMEWIPFNQFKDLKPFAKGGFATLYTAVWKRGSILDFNESKQKFVYQGPQKVVLKSLNNSTEPTE
ncbi:17394_t:CDS:2, partial [Cetraspora pellucida]